MRDFEEQDYRGVLAFGIACGVFVLVGLSIVLDRHVPAAIGFGSGILNAVVAWYYTVKK